MATFFLVIKPSRPQLGHLSVEVVGEKELERPFASSNQVYFGGLRINGTPVTLGLFSIENENGFDVLTGFSK